MVSSMKIFETFEVRLRRERLGTGTRLDRLMVPTGRSRGKIRSMPRHARRNLRCHRWGCISLRAAARQCRQQDPEARLHQDGAHAAVFVRQQQNLRGIVQGLDDFADHGIGRDDAHVFADAVTLAAIEIIVWLPESALPPITRALTMGYVRIVLAKFQERGKAIRLTRFALELRDFQFQGAVFTPQIFVFARRRCCSAK